MKKFLDMLIMLVLGTGCFLFTWIVAGGKMDTNMMYNLIFLGMVMLLYLIGVVIGFFRIHDLSIYFQHSGDVLSRMMAKDAKPYTDVPNRVKSIKGYIITSVTRIFACSKDTPRMAILSSKEYKEEINRLMEEAKKKPKERAKTLDELKDRIDTAGWSCSESKDENTGDVELELGRMSPAGEDFYIYVCGQTVEALISNLDNQACDFDEDDHVKLVMNMRGAPDLAALVKDAADIHEMLRKLSDTVCGR